MKKHISILPITLIIISIIVSCKKGDTPKDYGSSVKDKTWWGTFAYTDKKTEYYSVHFNADNSLTWSQYSGNYSGNWDIKENKIAITLTESSVQISAEISDGDTLINISDNTDQSSVYSGALIKSPIVFLDNTVWKGSINIAGNPYPFQMSFKADNKVDVTMSGSLFTETYTRSESGVCIKFAVSGVYNFFGIIISGSKMEGIDNSPEYSWQATKQ